MVRARTLTLTAGAIALAAFTGCSTKPQQIEKCEAILLPTLKAPSTYKLISNTIGLPNKDGSQDVFLNYDAVNSYNAPIRGLFWCVIGKDGTASAHDTEATVDDMVIPDAGVPSPAPSPTPAPKAAAAKPTYEDEVPVCDRPDSPEKSALMNEIGTDCMGD